MSSRVATPYGRQLGPALQVKGGKLDGGKEKVGKSQKILVGHPGSELLPYSVSIQGRPRSTIILWSPIAFCPASSYSSLSLDMEVKETQRPQSVLGPVRVCKAHALHSDPFYFGPIKAKLKAGESTGRQPL